MAGDWGGAVRGREAQPFWIEGCADELAVQRVARCFQAGKGLDYAGNLNRYRNLSKRLPVLWDEGVYASRSGGVEGMEPAWNGTFPESGPP